MTLKKTDIKIGSKLERFWTQVRDEASKNLEAHEQSVLLQKEVLTIAEAKIAEEKAKFK